MGRMAQLDRGRKPKIGSISPLHRSMARALVVGRLRPKDLAIQYGYSYAQISVIINSPLFKVEVARIEALVEHNTCNVRAELEALQPRSLEVLAEDLHSESGTLRNKTALEILDRTGHPKGAPVQKHTHLHGHLHAKVEKMDQRELYEEVMDLIEEDDGNYEIEGGYDE